MFPINLMLMNDEAVVNAAIEQLEQQMIARQFLYNRLTMQLNDKSGSVSSGVRKAQKRLIRAIETDSCRTMSLIRALKEDI